MSQAMKVNEERKLEQSKTEELQIAIGERIRELRKAKGLNQTELAIRMNDRDRQVVQRLEKGKTNCSLNLLRVAAEALEVELTEIFPAKKH
ncbi:MAG: hypothetical protein Crog4KO_24050 [Crocinitomicaceae bacterium]